MKSVSKILLFFFLTAPFFGIAQQIVYSDPEREDGRRTNFEIIGKINGNFLVFKNNGSNNAISIYDNDMKLVERVPLTFIQNSYTNIDFVSYSDHCYAIYEYQKK